MNCKEVQEKLSVYLDNELEASERARLEEHLADCPACQEELQDLQMIVEQLSSLDEMIPPLGFRTELFAKLEEGLQKREVSSPMSKDFFARLKEKFAGAKRYSGLVPVAIALILLILISPVLLDNLPRMGAMKNEITADITAPESAGSAGFSSSLSAKSLNENNESISPERGKMNDELAYYIDRQVQVTDSGTRNSTKLRSQPQIVPTVDADQATGNGEIAAQNQATAPGPNALPADTADTVGTTETEILDRKIIKNANLNLAVDDYDQALDEIRAKVHVLNGYIANESENTIDRLGTKRGSLQVRIPQPQFESFLEGMPALGEMKYKEIYSQDVTEEYIDITGRLKALRTKEERLLDILTKSGNLNEILAVENELANTRTQLESTEGRLRYLNNQTDFSTISITLEQMAVSTQQVTASGLKGVGQRAKAAFIEAINNILVGLGKLVVFLSAAIPYLVVLALLGLLIIAIWRKKRPES